MQADKTEGGVCRAIAVAGVLWAVASAAGVAQAQATADQKAAAEALFDRGLRLMREGKFAEACEQLEASQAIEQGIGTMLYLAECYEKLGRTASAWALFREAASQAEAAGQQERAAAGAERAERLEPQLSTLTIEVPEDRRVPGLEIQRDGERWPPATWDIPVPVDPGTHRLSASAPRYAPWEHEVNVSEQADEIVRLPELQTTDAAPSAPTEPPPDTQPAETTEPPITRAARSDDPGATMRLAGLVTAGAGVVAIGVGGFFGLRAISKNDDAEQRCPEAGDCADQAGVEASEDAQDAATLSNVLVFGGAAVTATGALLYFLAPSAEQPVVSLGVHPGGAALRVGGVF